RADDRIRARARARLAGVRLRAGIAVIARGAVGLGGGVTALARPSVLRAGGVALCSGRPDDRIRARARARLAGVRLRVGIAVIARGAVGLGGWVVARARRWVTRSAFAALFRSRADDRIRARARARLAGVRLRAGVAVIARGAVGLGGGV